ncbi:alpha/beta fold hydrolase [Thermocatellispora tengchongensis]|uniref:alpha/beta fold hydrolase n=1 Tax=Thermocatellispora tengchongensis TaxID=1073253 RepID=UPI0036269EC5
MHGWPQTSRAWRRVLPALAARHTVVVPDLPGFGDSSKPASGYDKRTVAGHLRELMRGLGHERYHVVGHDLGGQVAYALAAQWPGEVAALVFVEAGVPGLGGSLDAANPLLGGSWHFGFNMVPDLPEALVAGRERAYLRFLFLRDSIGLVRPEAIGPDDLDAYAEALAAPGGLRGSFAHYRALPQDIEDNRAWSAAGRLAMPVLVVGARQGVGLGWLDTVRAAAERVEARLVEDCGHYLPEERPEELVEILAGFLPPISAPTNCS